MVQRSCEPRCRRALAGIVAILTISLLTAAPAHAAVSVSRAELDGSSLRLEGTATANRDITVDAVVMGRSDSGGRFRIERSGYTPPADCTVDVNDGSATARTATLSGCTVTQPEPEPEPQPVARLTPDVDQIGPGFVGSDFVTFSTTTTTITFGPDTLGPVRFEIIAGALPAGLALVDPNEGFTPAKSIHASVDGTPTTVQTSTFTIRATDANGLTATRTYTIVINPAQPLAITPQPWGQLTVGEFSNLWVDGSGGVRPYQWTVSAGQLPPGMSLTQDNPDGPLVRVTGTPTAAGTFTFTLRLTDAQATTASRSFTVTVAPADTSTGPAAPTLLAPADGASVTTPFTIDWTQEFDPSLSANGGYNWQVSTTSTFSTLVLRDSTLPSVTEDTIGGIPNGTYFWRVQAVDGQLRSSDWSAPSSFIVTGTGANALPAPVLDPLPFGAHYFPMEHWRFTWSAVPGAASYTVEVSDDPAFPAPPDVKSDNEPDTTSGFTFGHSLIGTWHLRVYAVGSDGVAGAPSNVRTFTISYDAPIGPPPTPLSPADGATVSLPVTLDWSDAENPQDLGYHVQIATDPGFSNEEILIPFRTASEVTLPDLSPGTKYWRVRHAEGDASPTTAAFTDFSAVHSFTVAEANAPLAAPTLLAPANGARWAPNVSRTFDWSDVSGAASYTLQVSTSSAFTSIALERTVTTSQVALSFGTEGTRYWRVRATAGDGSPGPWSGTRSFRIKR